MPGAVSPDVLHFASIRLTLTVPEVVGTEVRVTSNLPFLLDPSSIAKMQSQSVVTDNRLLLGSFVPGTKVLINYVSNKIHMTNAH